PSSPATRAARHSHRPPLIELLADEREGHVDLFDGGSMEILNRYLEILQPRSEDFGMLDHEVIFVWVRKPKNRANSLRPEII
ncbi:MAG TPA: hypothetical protein VI729_11890, partial [Anaerolineales bacterium]|nr:hypothetical protein [Anaerolineales bacterium]